MEGRWAECLTPIWQRLVSTLTLRSPPCQIRLDDGSPTFALASLDAAETHRMSGFVSAASTVPCLMLMLALGLTMLSMSADQECHGTESCRPETVTYAADAQVCQLACSKCMPGAKIEHIVQVMQAATMRLRKRHVRWHLDTACALSTISVSWHTLLLMGERPNALGFSTQQLTDVGAIADDSPQEYAPDITTVDLQLCFQAAILHQPNVLSIAEQESINNAHQIRFIAKKIQRYHSLATTAVRPTLLSEMLCFTEMPGELLVLS